MKQKKCLEEQFKSGSATVDIRDDVIEMVSGEKIDIFIKEEFRYA